MGASRPHYLSQFLPVERSYRALKRFQCYKDAFKRSGSGCPNALIGIIRWILWDGR